MPVDQHSPASRITNGKRALVHTQLRSKHQDAQVMLINRRSYYHAGNTTQITQVERSVMRNTIFAHKTGAIYTERHRQASDRHIMNNVIVGALQE